MSLSLEPVEQVAEEPTVEAEPTAQPLEIPVEPPVDTPVEQSVEQHVEEVEPRPTPKKREAQEGGKGSHGAQQSSSNESSKPSKQQQLQRPGRPPEQRRYGNPTFRLPRQTKAEPAKCAPSYVVPACRFVVNVFGGISGESIEMFLTKSETSPSSRLR